jgi:hypothetical protein
MTLEEINRLIHLRKKHLNKRINDVPIEDYREHEYLIVKLYRATNNLAIRYVDLISLDNIYMMRDSIIKRELEGIIND